ncbi:hypothetical protein [Mobiluncus sp.]|uniref:hypothetical protein n=1 Tax=Mobiluncus sp. TaxID=47293 RepID=UPI002A90E34A|nr:hypothetical protein [Mobiluncus sp.]MDY6077121.1 hypothetical protein [Mobiluncus sp.]
MEYSTITLVHSYKDRENTWHFKHGKTVIATLKKLTALYPNEEVGMFRDGEIFEVYQLPIEIEPVPGLSELAKTPRLETLKTASELNPDLTEYVAELLAKQETWIPRTGGKQPTQEAGNWGYERKRMPPRYSTLTKQREKIQARLFDDGLDRAKVSVTVPDYGTVDFDLQTVDTLHVTCKCGFEVIHPLDEYRTRMMEDYGKIYAQEREIPLF